MVAALKFAVIASRSVLLNNFVSQNQSARCEWREGIEEKRNKKQRIFKWLQSGSKATDRGGEPRRLGA